MHNVAVEIFSRAWRPAQIDLVFTEFAFLQPNDLRRRIKITISHNAFCNGHWLIRTAVEHQRRCESKFREFQLNFRRAWAHGDREGGVRSRIRDRISDHNGDHVFLFSEPYPLERGLSGVLIFGQPSLKIAVYKYIDNSAIRARHRYIDPELEHIPRC